MTVYVVMWSCLDCDGVAAVFRTKENAEEFIRQQPADDFNTYFAEEFEVQ